MRYIQGIERSQMMLPTSLEDLIGEENPVRAMDAFVDLLDMKELGFEQEEPSQTGRPGYDPRMLLKLYLYGYFFSIRSSRKLMRECSRNIELFFLLEGLKPDFRTIADFRKTHSKSIRNAFVEFTRFCTFLELYDSAEPVAIDGSKFRAVNANKKMFNQEILTKKCQRIEGKLEQYLQELQQSDEEEGRQEAKHNQSGDPRPLKEKIKTLNDRKKQYEAWKAELAESGETQKLTTDPQARMMRMSKDGYHCCYNVQTAVSAESKLVVDYQVTNHINDQEILHDFSEQIKETVQAPVLRTIADKGYDCQEEVLQCLLDGTLVDVGFKDEQEEHLMTIAYQPAAISEKNRTSTKPEDIRRCLHAGVLPACYEGGNLSVEVHAQGEIGAFVRGEDTSYVTCPMGQRLNKTRDKNGGMVYACRPACRQCSNRCTASANYRQVYFGPNTSCVAARMYGEEKAVQVPPKGFVPNNSFFRKNQIEATVLLRMAHDPQKQRERLCISEHPFGTVKWHMGAHYVLCKGIEKTTAELGLTFLAYNFKRVLNSKKFGAIMEALREYKPSFFVSLAKRA